MFAREGYPFILGAAAIAAIAFVMAVRVRSWPLWLMALVLTVIALGVAWFFRNPIRVGDRAPTVALIPGFGEQRMAAPWFNGVAQPSGSSNDPKCDGIDGDRHVPLMRQIGGRVPLGQRRVSCMMVFADLPRT